MDFKFTDVGEGINEGEIVRWHVNEGDRVKENQTLVEVETDKAIVEIPSPCEGVIDAIPVDEGDIIEVGETLVVIETDEESQMDESTTVVGDISTETEVVEETEESSTTAEEVLATPKTRKIARDLNVNLETIEGTGKDGRITAEDVREAAGEDVSEASVKEEEDDHGPVRVKPLRGVRRRVAQQTKKSHETIPQVTHMDETDITNLFEELEDARSSLESIEYKLTLTPFFVKALVETLKGFPYLNARMRDDEEIVLKDYYNIGVTVDTEEGLIVPVVRDAAEKSLLEIGRELDRLAKRARNRSLELEELQGATFTLTNIGFIGGTWATPQINYPEAGILATGRASVKPVVRDDSIVKRRMLPLSLSFDHRLLDGADAARFINEFSNYLGNPDHFSLDVD